jgi:hypothetical protein|tara:strand:- start:5494 stop:5946 length:453 start_codon:yes stop_codon:yes gene_type:complete
MKGQVQKVDNGYFRVSDEDGQHLWAKMANGDVCDVVLMTPSQKRSVSQNALQHKHYHQIADFHGWTPEYAKNFCKYTYGVNILIGKDSEHPMYKYFEMVLGGLMYEQRIEAMVHIDLTSLFDKAQASAYTETIFREQGSLGVQLTQPCVD